MPNGLVIVKTCLPTIVCRIDLETQLEQLRATGNRVQYHGRVWRRTEHLVARPSENQLAVDEDFDATGEFAGIYGETAEVKADLAYTIGGACDPA